MEISVITANVSADFLSPPGVPIWDERKGLFVQALHSVEPDLIGLQEVTQRQRHFLQAQLPQFTALTVPVIDPDPELVSAWHDMYARFGLPNLPDPYELILFYRADAFELVASGYWWLSPTPERPSIGFGNIAPRAVVWAHLHHRPSQKEFILFNTHIDHRCTQPMVELCRQRFAEFNAQNIPLIFIGDFNFNPNDPDYALLIGDGWQDSHDFSLLPEASTIMYDLPHLMPGGRIDHILYRGDGFAPQAWARLLSPDPNRRISDHDPVHVRFTVVL